MTETRTTTQGQTATEERVDQPRQWNVILLNDEEHTYEYVIRMMQVIFGHSPERAYQIARTVDTQDRAVCFTAHKELAELKRDQIHAFGRDPLMRESKGSMTSVIEPADFGDGDGDDASGADGDPPRGS